VRRALSEAWLLARILLRFAAVAVLVVVMAAAVSHGGWWYLLLIPLAPVALFQLVISSGMLWLWAKELRHAG
jgi:hypothetical protein